LLAAFSEDVGFLVSVLSLTLDVEKLPAGEQPESIARPAKMYFIMVFSPHPPRYRNLVLKTLYD
jgi:hypothetical protein